MTQLRVLQGGRGWGRSYVTRSAKHAIQVTDLILQYAAGSLEEGGGLSLCHVQYTAGSPGAECVPRFAAGSRAGRGGRGTRHFAAGSQGDVWHSMLQVLQGAECI